MASQSSNALFPLMIGAGTAIRRRQQDPKAHEEFTEWSLCRLVVLLQRHERLAVVSILLVGYCQLLGRAEPRRWPIIAYIDCHPRTAKTKLRAFKRAFFPSYGLPALPSLGKMRRYHRCLEILVVLAHLAIAEKIFGKVEVLIASQFSSRSSQTTDNVDVESVFG